ncbi:MAG: FecR family protein [Bacteroidales bacterium]|nr:FecR family protein [Bacteroidales bacterium]
MDQTKIKQILDEYKKSGLSDKDASYLLQQLENCDNENALREFLYNELNTTAVSKAQADTINFHALFKRIRHKMVSKEKGVVTSYIRSQIIGFRFARIAAVLLIAFVTGALVSYLYLTRLAKISESYFEITTPMASTSKVMLPDGTEVIVNAGSKINYSDAFNKNDRKVHLEGEAYFKVAENRRLPFTVETSHLEIKALGTEFNVKAYSEEKAITATLVKGKIEIRKNQQGSTGMKPVFLESNQKAVFIKDQDKMAVITGQELEEITDVVPVPVEDTMYVIKGVDTKPAVVWTENKLIISKESMASLAVKLERKYDVIIRFADEDVRNFRFTGTLLDETIQQVLDAIKLTAPIYYTMEGKTITLYENRKMKDQFRPHMKQN